MCQDTDWMVDTGASFHVSPKRDFFASYKPGYYGVVRMANKDISLIVGVGDIHVETNLDYNWYSKCVACTGSSPQSYSARKVR